MDSAYYHQMYALEDGHWWFIARREFARTLLKQAVGPQDQPRILDLGCGTGGILDSLRGIGPTTGVDVEPMALDFCRERGHTDVIEASGTELPFMDACFDAVVALDVFEHIDDDCKAMEEAFRVLKPGGVAVITVPAYQGLWSRHDVALHHHRRYTLGLLTQRLEAAGFTVQHKTYTVSSLLPVTWFIRRVLGPFRNSGKPVSDIKPTPTWLNRALLGVLRMENSIASCCSVPFGVTAAVVVRKLAA